MDLLLALLPILVLVTSFLVLLPSLRRLRRRDAVAPPSTRTVALRTIPFVTILGACAVVGLATRQYVYVVWGVLGAAGFAGVVLDHSRKLNRSSG